MVYICHGVIYQKHNLQLKLECLNQIIFIVLIYQHYLKNLVILRFYLYNCRNSQIINQYINKLTNYSILKKKFFHKQRRQGER